MEEEIKRERERELQEKGWNKQSRAGRDRERMEKGV